ncbi:MAG: alpha/beta hydrolase [Sphingobacteriia bacterium]|jgi:acetyl esterase/lipase
MKLITTILALLITFNTMAQEEIPIYTGKIPNAIPCTLTTYTGKNPSGKLFYANIITPTLTVFKPNQQNALKSAILICPGGGYARVVVEHEGEEIAKAFNNIGVTVFMLKYRLPNDTCMINRSEVPLMDAQQSIKYIRDHAKEYNIDQNHVGVIGFSAGGHLASSLATKFQHNYIANSSNTNLRPDFMILGYPVISMNDSICHKGSRDRLIGKNPSKENELLYSSELQVSAQTPPAFIFHAKDDKTVPVINSYRMHEALEAQKVKSTLHIFEAGGHGFGLNNTSTSVKWFELATQWMKENKFI